MTRASVFLQPLSHSSSCICGYGGFEMQQSTNTNPDSRTTSVSLFSRLKLIWDITGACHFTTQYTCMHCTSTQTLQMQSQSKSLHWLQNSLQTFLRRNNLTNLCRLQSNLKTIKTFWNKMCCQCRKTWSQQSPIFNSSQLFLKWFATNLGRFWWRTTFFFFCLIGTTVLARI